MVPGTGTARFVVIFAKGPVKGSSSRSNWNAHLEGEGPAGGIVGAVRWASGVGKVVGVVLGLEHVEDVRAVGLSAEDDVRVFGVVFACDFESRRWLAEFLRPLFMRALTNFVCGGEVGLAGGEDVAARVALGGIMQDFFVEVGWRCARVFEGGCGGAFGGLCLAASASRASMRLGVTVQESSLPAFDGVLRHAVGVVEEVLALAGA